MLIIVIGLFRILFICSSVLRLLIIIEFIRIGLFYLIYNFYRIENVAELLIFIVFMVREGLLGLVVFILKVLIRGDDLIESTDVF